MMYFSSIILVSLLQLISAELEFSSEGYGCSICIATVDEMLTNKQSSLVESCLKFFPRKNCEETFSKIDNDKLNLASFPSGKEKSRNICRSLARCPSEVSSLEAFPRTSSGSAYNDIRVSKALGSRGYDKIRLSVISNSTIQSEYFTYSSQFQYRWTGNYISTGIVTATPGKKTTFNIAGTEVEVFIPLENTGVRGVITADPCFQSNWIVCIYQNSFQTFNRTIELLNAINAYDDFSFWSILGDNFYDQDGEATASWFNALSQASKSKVFTTVPGNHDFWVNGAPLLNVPKDQLGNGFMQFYAQDTIASAANSDNNPFDFSVNPDTAKKGNNLAAASNFFSYNKVGNIAFISYSGAHSFESMQSYFEEACNWAVSAQPEYVLLQGHWNSDGDGCTADSTPAVYDTLAGMPACAPLIPKMKYFMGHKHCNIVTAPNVGFMVGAMGMSDSSSCGGEFGIPIVDTTFGDFRVYYFSIAKAGSYDNYDKILSCVKANGASGCYDLATLWTSSSVV